MKLIDIPIYILMAAAFIPYVIYDAFVSHVLGFKYNTWGYRRISK
jgi:hypothetical protein